MMNTLTIRLYKPADLVGEIICNRLESDYCHATIQVGDKVYSATFPHILKLDPLDSQVALPPRKGAMFSLTVSDVEAARVKKWLDSMVGTDYDVLSMLGWFLRIKFLQMRKNVYCFEFVREALAQGGLLESSKNFVSGDQLLVSILLLGAQEVKIRK